MVGESMIYGKGAGFLPTGSAVVSDILDIAFDIHKHQSHRNLEADISPISVVPIDQQQTQFYCRLLLKDHPGALEELSNEFKDKGINISQLIQKERVGDTAEMVIITDTVVESAFDALKQSLNALPAVDSIESIIRVGL